MGRVVDSASSYTIYVLCFQFLINEDSTPNIRVNAIKAMGHLASVCTEAGEIFSSLEGQFNERKAELSEEEFLALSWSFGQIARALPSKKDEVLKTLSQILDALSSDGSKNFVQGVIGDLAESSE